MRRRASPVSTIRLRSSTRDALRQITGVTGESMQEALERAVEERRRRIYLAGLAQDYAALRRDRKASSAWDAELSAWETSDTDGLEGL